jgi:hypothetical protein
MLPNYVLETKPVSCGGWRRATLDDRMVPVYREQPRSRARVALAVDAEAGTREWWRAMTNPHTWSQALLSAAEPQRPFYACPFPIGIITRFEAEDFDRGGEGHGYHSIEPRGDGTFRSEPVDILPAGDIPGGYNVGAQGGYAVNELRAGEWLAYTLDLPLARRFSIRVRAATEKKRAKFHLSMENSSLGDWMPIPLTGGIPHWTTVESQAVLPAGRHILRLLMDEGKGSFNFLEFIPEL